MIEIVSYLRNTVSGIAHDNLQEALAYYDTTLIDGGYYQHPTKIDSLYDLCDVLNEMDVYGCGSSFSMEQWTFKYGEETL